MMKVGILTSSRADFGIYLPLLRALRADVFFSIEIIAFGTHLSPHHGHTIDNIIAEGFEVKYTVESMLLNDDAEAIATAASLTSMKFASFWSLHEKEFDLVFCLGDRYEMFAAVLAGLPFQIKFAHLHGGEQTLGAIDNVFRHCISHASYLHFTSTQFYAERLKAMLDHTKHIYNVGALSLENLKQIKLLSPKKFQQKWNIDLRNPTVLITFHPETVDVKNNEQFTKSLTEVIKANKQYQYLITMPNADTNGSVIRKIFIKELGSIANVFMIENLGTQSYFTALNNCKFLIGNSSSGIIEAASFGKFVINIGKRQEGRYASLNVFNVSAITTKKIQSVITEIEEAPVFSGENVYFKKETSKQIIKVLKKA